MTAPAGPCEWCGGPQSWTFRAGEMWVSCDDGCQELDLEGASQPPPNSEEGLLQERARGEGGTFRMEEGVPLLGGDPADHSTPVIMSNIEPPSWWLDSLWCGFDWRQ